LKMKLVSILLLLGIFSSATALSCLDECYPRGVQGELCVVCPELNPEDCTSGELAMAPCTCMECAKAEGESCAGFWGFSGKCASYLTCKIPEKEDDIDRTPRWDREGICIKKEPPLPEKEEGMQGESDQEISTLTSEGEQRGRKGYNEEADKKDEYGKVDPCNPSPCGINAVCNERNNATSCTCLPGLQGNPYIECKPECTINQECPLNKACVNQKCRDPCPGVCGARAICSVSKHYPSCRCEPGYEGDPFSICYRKTTLPPKVEPIDPCNPSSCGSNAVCKRQRNTVSCQCIPGYYGDPYVACRRACVVHSDCPSNNACQRKRCIDPCPGICGLNAVCEVHNHNPTCKCIPNYIGDPFTTCRQKPLEEGNREGEDYDGEPDNQDEYGKVERKNLYNRIQNLIQYLYNFVRN